MNGSTNKKHKGARVNWEEEDKRVILAAGPSLLWAAHTLISLFVWAVSCIVQEILYPPQVMYSSLFLFLVSFNYTGYNTFTFP